MQVQTCKRLIMLSVLGVLTTVSAHAQYVKPFRVTIPFNFYVGGKALTAGQYTVGRGSETTAETIVLSGIDGGAGVFALTRGIQADEVQLESKLVFRRYGDQYFLGEIWTFQRNSGRELPISRKERLIKEENARLGASPEKVAVHGNKR